MTIPDSQFLWKCLQAIFNIVRSNMWAIRSIILEGVIKIMVGVIVRVKGLFGNQVVPNQIVVWSGLEPKKGNS